MSNLQKKISCLLTVLVLNSVLYAQSSYMHEIAEDAGYRNTGWSFLMALQWVVILGIGLLFIVGFGISWISQLFESPSSTPSTPSIDPNKIVLKGEFHNGWARFRTYSGKYGYINSSGSILKCISPNDTHFDGIQYFTEAEEFVHNVVIVELENGQYALINQFGQNVNTRYEKKRNETYIKELENGLIYYSRSNHQHHDLFAHECYVYNRNGEMVYDGVLKEIKVNKDGNLEIANNKESAIMTPQGKFIIPFCCKSVHLKGSLYKVFSSNGLCGVYDNSKEKMILSYGHYGNLLYIEEQNLFLCSQYRETGTECGWSIVDINEKELFSINAVCVEVLNEKYLLITQLDKNKNYLRGIYSFSGRNIVPPLYDQVLSSLSVTEFLAKSTNSNDNVNYKYTLYNLDGMVASFEDFSSVRYHTIEGSVSDMGIIRGIDIYSRGNEYKKIADYPAFIELTKMWDDEIRVSIVNMKNEVIIPADYISIRTIRDEDNWLTGFQATKPKPDVGDYVKFNLEGEKIGEGNIINDKKEADNLERMFPGYQSDYYRLVYESIWLDNHNDDLYRDDDLYYDDDLY